MLFTGGNEMGKDEERRASQDGGLGITLGRHGGFVFLGLALGVPSTHPP